MAGRMLRFARRLLGTVLSLVLLICGTEIGVRLYELKTRRPLNPARSALGVGGLIVPSWSVRQELRPFASLKVKTNGEQTPHQIKINSLGMRGGEIAVPKPPDVYRVLCLGDELLFSPQTAEESSLCTSLQQALQPESSWQVEVLNGGIPGASPLTEYLMLHHRWSVVRPDIVLLTITESDLADEAANRRFTRSDHAGRPLTCRHPSLVGKSTGKPWAAWRQEFRLIDLGMSWCGESWKRQTEPQEYSRADEPMENAPRLAFDRAAALSLLQPLVSLAEWCRDSNAMLCVCCLSANRTNSAAPPWILAVQELSEQHQFLLTELPLPDAAEKAGGKRRWPVESQRSAAEQLGELLVMQSPGPWNSAHQQELISPASYPANRHPRRLRETRPLKNR